jgi:DNA-binding response OmpR family regulator
MSEENPIILIVDDDQNIVKYLSALMAREGFKTLQAFDGKTALGIVRSGKPDVMLLDLVLPEMNGMEVLRQAKNLDPNLPIIIITGCAEIRGSTAAIKAGAFEYLPKPIDRSELVRVVHLAIAERKLKGKVKEPSTQDLLSTLGSEVEATEEETLSLVHSSHNLDSWVRRLSSKEMPILAGTARNIGNIAENDKSSGAELACAILEDAFLTSRVLKVANSAYYAGIGRGSNLSAGQGVTTVNQAVMRLGFNEIRSMGQSKSIIEGLLKGPQRERLQKAMADAFHAAVQAKWLANSQKDNSSEEVFIATLLYNLGNMVFWCFADEGQSQKMENAMQMHGDSNTRAEMETLGFSLQELTARLGKEWRLGPLLQEALDESSPVNPRTENIVLGYKLAQEVEKGWNSEEVRELTKQMAEILHLPEEEVTKSIHANAKEATTTAASWGASTASQLIPIPNDNPAESLHSVIKEEEVQPEEPRYFQPDLVLQLRILHELSTLLIDRTKDYNLLMSLVIEGISRGIGMDRILFTLLRQDQLSLVVKYALGWSPEEMQGVIFDPSVVQDSLLGHILRTHQPLWVQADLDKKISKLLTPEISRITNKASFFIMPIVVREKAIGLIYADRHTSRRELDADSFASFQHFCQQASMGLSL